MLNKYTFTVQDDSDDEVPNQENESSVVPDSNDDIDDDDADKENEDDVVTDSNNDSDDDADNTDTNENNDDSSPPTYAPLPSWL